MQRKILDYLSVTMESDHETSFGLPSRRTPLLKNRVIKEKTRTKATSKAEKETKKSPSVQQAAQTKGAMKNSMLANGLRTSANTRKATQPEHRRRNRLMQSMAIASNTLEDHSRDDSLEQKRISQPERAGSDEGSLPRIGTNEPIRIKNKIYMVVDKYPGKPMFKNDQLLKPEEVFIGGVDEPKSNDLKIGKNRHSHLVKSAVNVPGMLVVQDASPTVEEKRAAREPSKESAKTDMENMRVKVRQIMPTYQGQKVTEAAIKEQSADREKKKNAKKRKQLQRAVSGKGIQPPNAKSKEFKLREQAAVKDEPSLVLHPSDSFDEGQPSKMQTMPFESDSSETPSEEDNVLVVQNPEPPKPKREFKPTQLHAFLKNYYFKNKDEVENLETSNRLNYRLNRHNRFTDFIQSHEDNDLKDFYTAEPKVQASQDQSPYVEDLLAIPEFQPALQKRPGRFVCKHNIHGVCKCQLIRVMALRTSAQTQVVNDQAEAERLIGIYLHGKGQKVDTDRKRKSKVATREAGGANQAVGDHMRLVENNSSAQLIYDELDNPKEITRRKKRRKDGTLNMLTEQDSSRAAERRRSSSQVKDKETTSPKHRHKPRGQNKSQVISQGPPVSHNPKKRATKPGSSLEKQTRNSVNHLQHQSVTQQARQKPKKLSSVLQSLLKTRASPLAKLAESVIVPAEIERLRRSESPELRQAKVNQSHMPSAFAKKLERVQQSVQYEGQQQSSPAKVAEMSHIMMDSQEMFSLPQISESYANLKQDKPSMKSLTIGRYNEVNMFKDEADFSESLPSSAKTLEAPKANGQKRLTFVAKNQMVNIMLQQPSHSKASSFDHRLPQLSDRQPRGIKVEDQRSFSPILNLSRN